MLKHMSNNDVPVGFVTPPPPIVYLNVAFLRSPKGGCCSISDDLSCSTTFGETKQVVVSLSNNNYCNVIN